MAKLQWLVAVSAILLVAGNSPVAGQGLLELASAAPQYSTLVTALNITGLVPALADILKTSPVTVFAPDNDAFAKLPAHTLTYLTTTMAGKEDLANILKYHVVKGSYPSPQPGKKLLSLLGRKLFIFKGWKNQNLFVNNVKITAPGLINVEQGVVHGIGSVLIPPQYTYLLYGKRVYYKWYWPGYYGHWSVGYWRWW